MTACSGWRCDRPGPKRLSGSLLQRLDRCHAAFHGRVIEPSGIQITTGSGSSRMPKRP